MGNGCIETEAAGERITLMPQRAAFWPARRTLLVADLHLGKGETLAASGVPVPRGVAEADLSRLSHAVSISGADRVLVLGDLLHAGIGIVQAMVEQVAAWLRSIDAEVWVVPGNHDRRIRAVAQEWNLRICDPCLDEGPFLFVHDAECAPENPRYVWAGHVHPLFRLAGDGDSLALPCFVLGERTALLPAFSRFTAGVRVQAGTRERVWGIADDRVIEISRPPRRVRVP